MSVLSGRMLRENGLSIQKRRRMTNDFPYLVGIATAVQFKRK